MFFPWTPMDAALMGKAIEQEKQLRALQSARSALAENTEIIKEKLDEISKKQSKSDAENLALKKELARLKDALIEQQRSHEEALKKKAEFDDKLRLYSMQFISEGLSPIEADSHARDEIQIEHELSLALPYVEGIVENLIKDLTINPDGRNKLVEFFQIMDTAREPKFSPKLLAEQNQLARQKVTKILISQIEANAKKSDQSLSEISFIYRRINKSQPAEHDAVLESIESSVATLVSLTKFTEDLFEVATELGVLEILEIPKNAWARSAELKITDFKVQDTKDFLCCAIAGSAIHWSVLREQSDKLNATNFTSEELDRVFTCFVVCALQNNDNEALLALLASNTRQRTLNLVINSIINRTTDNNLESVVNQLHEDEILTIDRIYKIALACENHDSLLSAYSLLLSLSPEIYPKSCLEVLSKKIIEIIRSNNSENSNQLLQSLIKFSDRRTLSLVIKSGNASAIESTLSKLPNLDTADDGELIWALAKIAQKEGKVKKAGELKKRARELKSVQAFYEMATKAIKTQDLSKLSDLNWFTEDLKISDETEYIFGAINFLSGLQHKLNKDYWQAELQFQIALSRGVEEAQMYLAKLNPDSMTSQTAPNEDEHENVGSNDSARTRDDSVNSAGTLVKILWWMAFITVVYAVWRYS